MIRRRLERARVADPPPSLAAVLRELGVDTQQAKRTSPAACRAIAARYRRWRAARGRRREAESAALVREAIARIRAEGRYPSRHQVQRLLPSSVNLRDPALNAIWTAEARQPGRTFFR